MFRALYTAASGMNAQELNLQNIANNLSNANTIGFRSRQVQFEDLMYQNVEAPGGAETQQTTIPTGLQLGVGARPSNTSVNTQQGELENTGNQLDMAIQGDGYFQVLTPTGTLAYTRGGSFQLNQERQIVTSDGNPIQPAITIPANATSITIGTDGTVSVSEPGQTQAAQVGTIQLALFPNDSGLQAIGGNLSVPTTASGDPVVGAPGSSEGMGSLQQGMLEQSNVDVVSEFVNMVLAQRSYEANSRVLQAGSQMLQDLNNIT
jgi:flagellar basal-body rod protein FlgG